ncbi:hypothetical protein B4589_009975 [Halolamina sp. CBA1230]|uniref:DUF7342 family protein n=1 Tax=Halolamina sp. CBA1230 TaxID=1853690 RepID=UPI0009A14A24|nr:hypothetical protein [Halolamina sp. CBA1230]QKY20689.1 hypothetical protein B4589_009975 [Halolamina sp. CBA1230]
MTEDRGALPEDARQQWEAERTTFQRVYDVVTGTAEYTTATEIADRAACSTTGARDALSQLVEMRIAEQRGDRPTEYRRNDSYLRWKRIERLAEDHTAAALREELDALVEEDESLQERFDAPDPDAVSPAVFDDADHEGVHDRWDALSRWRTVREDLGVIQRAIHRAERNTDDRTGRSASA